MYIRLNNKPYPVKDNSFEMWNSYFERSIIEKIKNLTKNTSGFIIVSTIIELTANKMITKPFALSLSKCEYGSTVRQAHSSPRTLSFYCALAI